VIKLDRNTLFYGDNLPILREYIPDESVDLIYLDPPFNSSRTYNVLFKDESGHESDAQITAFEDTWHWNQSAEEAFFDLVQNGPAHVSKMIRAMRDFIGTNQMMAYLVMMAIRLVDLHRVLKPTGSLYLHCDPTASHYLKIILDAIFKPENFRNEITWKRRVGMSSAVHESNRFGVCTDIILFFAKSNEAEFNPQYNLNSSEYQEYIKARFTYLDENGRHFQPTSLVNPSYRPNLIYDYKGYQSPPNGWMITKEKMEEWDREGRLYFPDKLSGRIRRKSFADELKGMPVQNLWTDIYEINSQAAERLGYPTQKPLALLERIVKASSNEGDTILDPFCGCGTAIAAAQKLKRSWIGIDITHLAIALQKYRLKDMFNIDAGKDYKVIGEPTDLGSARQLASENRYQFQWWALSLAKAKPIGGEGKTGKKGKDRGIDGMINFIDDKKETVKDVLVQVKSGKVKSGDIRDLRGTVEREGASMGVFVTLETPTQDMETEAVSAGFYESGFGTKFPKIQICTVEELQKGYQVKMPPFRQTFKQAKKEETQDKPQQLRMMK